MLEGGNLTIVDLEPGDQGLYECVANSHVTASVSSTMLLIEGELTLKQEIELEYNLFRQTSNAA
jgi:hypothetical protein